MEVASLLELSHENVWYDKSSVEDAELEYQHHLANPQQHGCSAASPAERGGCPASKCTASSTSSHKSSIVSEIAKAREHIKQSLNSNAAATSSHGDSTLTTRITHLETDNKHLRQMMSDLEAVIKRLESRVTGLEKNTNVSAPSAVASTAAVKVNQSQTAAPQVNGVVAKKDDDEADDDFELFGDDNEEDDADAERLKQERVKAYEEKKAKKPVLIAKSNIILDVKPWDDETDMVALENCVRSIVMDGLLWGSSKLVPLAYTIKKLQISCVVEDDKVSVDDLEEQITAFEDYVQSIDIAAFNKI